MSDATGRTDTQGTTEDLSPTDAVSAEDPGPTDADTADAEATDPDTTDAGETAIAATPRGRLRTDDGRPGGPGFGSSDLVGRAAVRGTAVRGAAAPRAPGARRGPEVLVAPAVVLGLAVLVVLVAARPPVVGALVGLPLALLLPGAVLQLRWLPVVTAAPLAVWGLRAAVALAGWALVTLAVSTAGLPAASVWPGVVIAVLLASVVVADPAAWRRRVGAAAVGGLTVAVVGLIATVGLAAGLLALGRGAGTAGAAGSDPADGVVVGFADPAVPLQLAATGGQAQARVALNNVGAAAVTVTVGAVVGNGVPWSQVVVRVPAGGHRTVELSGPVPVCSDPQQAAITVERTDGTAGTDRNATNDDTGTAPLTAVVPGAAGGAPCA